MRYLLQPRTVTGTAVLEELISLEQVDLEDDAAWDAWSARVGARSERGLADEKRRLESLGLINEDWTSKTTELPEDMLSSSRTSVET